MIPFSPYLSDAACAAREQALVCRIAGDGLRAGESVPPRIAHMAAEVRAGRLGFVTQQHESARSAAGCQRQRGACLPEASGRRDAAEQRGPGKAGPSQALSGHKERTA